MQAKYNLKYPDSCMKKVKKKRYEIIFNVFYLIPYSHCITSTGNQYVKTNLYSFSQIKSLGCGAYFTFTTHLRTSCISGIISGMWLVVTILESRSQYFC